MKRLTKASLAGLGSLVVLTALASSDAQAQGAGTPPPRRTPVSPYIGLAGRTGGAAAFDYYRRIQPELQWRNSIQNLQQQVRLTQSAVTGLEQNATALPGTGHATHFMNLGGYFQSGGAGQGAGARPQAAAGQAPQRASGGRSGGGSSGSGNYGGRSGR